MTRNRMLLLTVLTLLVATFLTVSPRSATAERGYSVRSLRGTYIGGLVEVRLPPGGGTEPLEYCDSAGTMIFDGAGNGVSTLARRCSLSGTVTDTLTLTYSVTPDGSAQLMFSEGTAGLFRLAQDGQIAFITAVGDTDATVLVHNGVFARQ